MVWNISKFHFNKCHHWYEWNPLFVPGFVKEGVRSGPQPEALIWWLKFFMWWNLKGTENPTCLVSYRTCSWSFEILEETQRHKPYLRWAQPTCACCSGCPQWPTFLGTVWLHCCTAGGDRMASGLHGYWQPELASTGKETKNKAFKITWLLLSLIASQNASALNKYQTVSSFLYFFYVLQNNKRSDTSDWPLLWVFPSTLLDVPDDFLLRSIGRVYVLQGRWDMQVALGAYLECVIKSDGDDKPTVVLNDVRRNCFTCTFLHFHQVVGITEGLK